MKPSVFLMIALFLMGCSNKQIYTAVQENRRVECSKLPQVQFEKCMSEYDTPYEEYQRERQAVIKNESAQ
jgi:PBP1b-binding outer membrane lipoprotein LpoB